MRLSSYMVYLTQLFSHNVRLTPFFLSFQFACHPDSFSLQEAVQSDLTDLATQRSNIQVHRCSVCSAIFFLEYTV